MRLNPTTKTVREPEGILRTVRAQDSLALRNFYDYVTGRSKWLSHDPLFQYEEDPFGNTFLNMDTHALEGYTIWVVNKWKAYKVLLDAKKIGINPRVLFRPVPDAPPQTAQMSGSSPA